MSPLLGIPVEIWIKIFHLYMQVGNNPNLADLQSFEIDALHQSLYYCNPVEVHRQNKVCLMLVCRTWKSIAYEYIDIEEDMRGPSVGSSATSNAYSMDNIIKEILSGEKVHSQLILKGSRLKIRQQSLDSPAYLYLHCKGPYVSLYTHYLLPQFSLYTIEEMIQDPSDLEMLHMATIDQVIHLEFFSHMATTFTNLKILSLLVYTEGMRSGYHPYVPVTFPQVTTLLIDSPGSDWTQDLTHRLQFPALRHLSIDLWPLSRDGTVTGFYDLLSKYQSQLISLRSASWSSHNYDLPFSQLETFATDFSMFQVQDSFMRHNIPIQHHYSPPVSVSIQLQPTFTDSIPFEPSIPRCSIRYLIHVPRLDWSFQRNTHYTLDYRRRMKKGYYESGPFVPIKGLQGKYDVPHWGSNKERDIYRGIMEAISCCPNLEAVYIPRDVQSVRTGTMTKETALSLSSLRELCEPRGVRILDTAGDAFPLYAVVSEEESHGADDS